MMLSCLDDSWADNGNPYKFLLEMKINIEPYVLLIVVSVDNGYCSC